MTRKRKATCPRCGSAEVVPIEYGYPPPEAIEEAKAGKIQLGGCCVTGHDPRKYCKACGNAFDRPRSRPRRRFGNSKIAS